MKTIKIKCDEHGHWLALLPSVGMWLMTPFFLPCPASEVKAALESRNPGHVVEVQS